MEVQELPGEVLDTFRVSPPPPQKTILFLFLENSSSSHSEVFFLLIELRKTNKKFSLTLHVNTF
jgi:hypothetical protein